MRESEDLSAAGEARRSELLTIPRFFAIMKGDEKHELTISVKFTGGKIVRTGYVEPDVFRLLLTALMPANRLALEVSMATGLRIADVLHLKTEALVRTARPTITERKTGKRRRVYFPRALRDTLLRQAGRYYVFEGRYDERRPRTRQAVFKDIKRVARMYRVDGEKIRANVAPHTARKIYAVQDYRAHGSLERVRRLLNHSDEAVTALYALADRLERKQRRSGAK